MEPKTDKITLKQVGLKRDQLLLVDQTDRPSISHIQPSNLLNRLRSFLPEIAAANEGLSVGEQGIDAEVVKVLPIEGGSDSECVSDEDTNSEEENDPVMDLDAPCADSTKVEIKIDLFRSKDILDSSDISVHDVKTLPKGFAETEEDEEQHKATKKLIEIL